MEDRSLNHTPLANRYSDWYENCMNHWAAEDLPLKAEAIMSKYIELNNYGYVDDMVDALPLEGKAKLLAFLDEVEYDNDLYYRGND